MADLSFRRVDTLTLAKAIAITLIVANHAKIAPGLHGGLNALLALSGIAMATYGFNGTTAETLRSFWRFFLRLSLPCFAVALVWDSLMLVLGERNATWLKFVLELGLISNWIWPRFLALFPFWYVQVVAQMLLALSLIFWMTDLTTLLRRRPVTTSAIALGLSLALAVFSWANWNTVHLGDKLPQLLLWNFVFGWFFWAMTRGDSLSIARRLVLSAVLIGCSVIAYLPYGAHHGVERAFWFPAIMLVSIWWRSIPMPHIVAQPTLLIAQATLVIFIAHYYFFGVVRGLLFLLDVESSALEAWLSWAAAMLISVLCWVLGSAVLRVVRRRIGTNVNVQVAAQP